MARKHPNKEQFLKELTELTIKHGITIGGDSSPMLLELDYDKDTQNVAYTYCEDSECLYLSYYLNLPLDYTKLNQSERRAVREQYTKQQKGLCYFCKGDLYSEPPKSITEKPIDWGALPRTFLLYPIHLHHCHKTNMTIGAVHSHCNAYLRYCHGET